MRYLHVRIKKGLSRKWIFITGLFKILDGCIEVLSLGYLSSCLCLYVTKMHLKRMLSETDKGD